MLREGYCLVDGYDLKEKMENGEERMLRSALHSLILSEWEELGMCQIFPSKQSPEVSPLTHAQSTEAHQPPQYSNFWKLKTILNSTCRTVQDF